MADCEEEEEEFIEPDCWDYWARGARSLRQMGGDPLAVGKRYAYSDESIVRIINHNRYGLYGFMALNGFLVFVIMWGVFVDGFTKFDGAAGEVSTVSHWGFWQAVELLAIGIGIGASRFGLVLTASGKMQKGAQNAISWLRAYKWLLFIAAIVHVIHAILSILELGNCTSTFCTQQRHFLVVLIVLLFILAGMDIWTILRASTYSSHIIRALTIMGNDFLSIPSAQQSLMEKGKLTASSSSNSVPPPSASSSTTGNPESVESRYTAAPKRGFAHGLKPIKSKQSQQLQQQQQPIVVQMQIHTGRPHRLRT